jgi:hypothetical protein
MQREQFDYLRSLVRMDIRKRTRALARFAAKPGQDPAEAEAVREKMAGDLAWKHGVLDALNGERRSEGVQAIAQGRQYLADGRVPVQDGDLITQAMWHLATEGIRPRLERLALAGALVAMEIEQELHEPRGAVVIEVRAGDET